MNLGKAVKLHRIQQDMDQRELADATGYSIQYIGFIEQNRRTPSVKALGKIAKALNVETSQLMSRAENL